LKKNPQCVVLLASHFDTKIVPGVDYLGANDSGSSSVALLEMLRRATSMPHGEELKCDLMAVWFDGEESVLDGWNDGRGHPAKIQDNTYGSRHLADNLARCSFLGDMAWCLPQELGSFPVVSLILLDMIGSKKAAFSRDDRASPELMRMFEKSLEKRGKASLLSKNMRNIEDDHVPFVNKGIPSINLINFEETQTWHRAEDVEANISYENIELAASIALNLAFSVANDPKGFPTRADKKRELSKEHR
jgi:hypothetical protein